MPSQKPTFEFQPPIIDVFRQLNSFRSDLAQEVDSPVPKEIERAVTLLAQRDRQLEDFLTGHSFVGMALYSGGAGTLTWQGPQTIMGNIVYDQWLSGAVNPSLVFNHGVTYKGGHYVVAFRSTVVMTNNGGGLTHLPSFSYSLGIAPDPSAPNGIHSTSMPLEQFLSTGNTLVTVGSGLFDALPDPTLTPTQHGVNGLQTPGDSSLHSSLNMGFTETGFELVVLQVN